MVLFGCDKVLAFKVQHLEVILIGLPQITQDGPQGMIQLHSYQAGDLHSAACVAALKKAVEDKDYKVLGIE